MTFNNAFTSFSIVLFTVWMGSTIWAATPQPSVSPTVDISAGDMALPINGQPGKCYARVFEDPIYRTETEQITNKEASERIEIIPAKYEIVEEQVLIRAAYQKEQIIPAQFETVSEKILVKPASKKWKKGRGLVEKIDNFTGEIMCLVDDPAEYQTITKQVVKTTATTNLVEIPAEYKMVKVNKLITPSKESRISIPAEYQTVTKTFKESDGRMSWQEVLCETNAPELVKAQPTIPETHIQSRSIPHAISGNKESEEKDWFFMWDYNELFNDGKWVRAE